MSFLLPSLLILIFVLLNGLFVAAEFAIIGVRSTRIRQLVAEGDRAALRIRDIVVNPIRLDRFIAAAQLGITVASLGLGMYAEPVVAGWIEGPLEVWFGLRGSVIHTVSFIISLSFITYLHVVLGEMIPKSLALQAPERLVFALVGPMSLVVRVLDWPIRGLNWIGLRILDLFRVPPPARHGRGYTADELELIVLESVAGGLVEEREQQLVSGILDFSERSVEQVMTPRTSIVAAPVDISEDDLIGLMAETAYSRLPIFSEDLDNIVGVLHLKDFVRQQLSEEPYNLPGVMREVIFVPETLSLDRLMASFREQKLHMAIVIDEHGGTLGLVTLEDLIEEVVGEVRDEFDVQEEPPLLVIEPGHLIVQGNVLLETLSEYVDLGEPREGVQTLGGLAMIELALPPKVGDEMQIGDATIRVEGVDGLSIRRLSVHFPLA